MGLFRKIKQLPLFAMVFTYVFLASALIISTLCVLLVVIWPVSKNLYRRISSWLVYTVFARKLVHRYSFIYGLIVKWVDRQTVIFFLQKVSRSKWQYSQKSTESQLHSIFFSV